MQSEGNQLTFRGREKKKKKSSTVSLESKAYELPSLSDQIISTLITLLSLVASSYQNPATSHQQYAIFPLPIQPSLHVLPIYLKYK